MTRYLISPLCVALRIVTYELSRSFAILLTKIFISGFDKSKIFNGENEHTCDPEKKRGVYVARTEYNILMHDSKNTNQKWNVTFFDYTSLAMGKEMLNDYGKICFILPPFI
jgi:hypothetical protein